MSEAPCFPTNSRVVATWFPQQERAFATGVYTVGEYVGLAFLSPLLFWIMGAFGWRALFVVVGVAGILFGLFWWRSYREPHESSTVNQAELDYIAAGGGIVTPLVIGFIVAATGSFVGALMFIAIVALVGAFSYIFIVGDIHRIELT